MSDPHRRRISPKGAIRSEKVAVFRIPNTIPVDNSPLIVYSSKNLPLDFKTSQIQKINSFDGEEVFSQLNNDSLHQKMEKYAYQDDSNYIDVSTDDNYYYNNEKAVNDNIRARDSYYKHHNNDFNIGNSEKARVAHYSDNIPEIWTKKRHDPLDLRNNIPCPHKIYNEDDLHNSNEYFQEESYNFVPYSSKPLEEFYNSGSSGKKNPIHTPRLSQKTQYCDKQKELVDKNVLYQRYSLNPANDQTKRSKNLSKPKKGTRSLYDTEDNVNGLYYTSANQIDSKSSDRCALYSPYALFNRPSKKFDNTVNNQLRQQKYDALYSSQAMETETKEVNNSLASTRAGLLYGPKYSFKPLKDGSNIETSNVMVDTEKRNHINVNKARNWLYNQNKNDSPLYGPDRHYKSDIGGTNNEINNFKTVIDNTTNNPSSYKTSPNLLNTKPQNPHLRSKPINISNNITRYTNLSLSDNDPLNNDQGRLDDCVNEASAISRPINFKKSDHNNVPCKKTKSVTFKL
uniref:Uncharacterized protein n=1 Tax=Diabrotica virgifera virgifera TaxID=50390 RepID=A0A6P7F5B9_DIAVI